VAAEKNWKSTLENVKRKTGELVESAPELSKFIEYVHTAESPNALDTKTKELISLAIAVVIRCEPVFSGTVKPLSMLGQLKKKFSTH